jgi:hypothetical protein
MGASPTKAVLSPGSLVVQFRKAVKAEHSNKLSLVDAADLIVYENKTSFEKEEPLEEDSVVTDLGKPKRDPLVVIVPQGIIGTWRLIPLSTADKKIASLYKYAALFDVHLPLESSFPHDMATYKAQEIE